MTYNQIVKYLKRPQELYSLGFPEELFNGFCIMNTPYPSARYAQNCNKNKKARNSFEDCTDNILKTGVFEETCSRCRTGFFVASTGYSWQELCYYHYGKLEYQWREPNVLFTCCGRSSSSRGCSVGQMHVWSGLENGLTDKMEGFLRTQPRMNRVVRPEIYALTARCVIV
ncbi:hypothetical protein WA026_023591 [Henosepilachna vigintioctopunctata]|uniref:Uncharacterized protein n=1 Tax=Henosepilachna vigintioctopunctata TaxID=420089 RepID=A0AAW1V4H3_9CUCU